MWILTGLLGLIRQDGCVPRDPQLFNQFVSSLSMSLAHQSNIASAGAIFTCLKRRCRLVRHLQVLKLALLSSSFSASSLFDESELSKFISLAGQSSLIQSQQAIVDLASAMRDPRSPRRSPAHSPRSSSLGSSHSKSPKSPSLSPKHARFSGTPPPSSSTSSLKKKKNFQQ